jgi:hypothetical protein
MSGDDLSIALFLVGLAMTFLIGGVQTAGHKSRLLIWTLYALAIVSLSGAFGWLWIKTAYPYAASVFSGIATSPVAWFIILIFVIALLTLSPQARNDASGRRDSYIWAILVCGLFLLVICLFIYPVGFPGSSEIEKRLITIEKKIGQPRQEPLAPARNNPSDTITPAQLGPILSTARLQQLQMIAPRLDTLRNQLDAIPDPSLASSDILDARALIHLQKVLCPTSQLDLSLPSEYDIRTRPAPGEAAFSSDETRNQYRRAFQLREKMRIGIEECKSAVSSETNFINQEIYSTPIARISKP